MFVDVKRSQQYLESHQKEYMFSEGNKPDTAMELA
jgi:hypothetical protein